MCQCVYQCILTKNSIGVLYIAGLPKHSLWDQFCEMSYRWEHMIMISLHILDRITICVPARNFCFLKVSCFILIHHTPQLSRKQNQESEDVSHTLWFCTSGDSHCILLFTHIISCSQNIISIHILSSDSHYAQLCFPCTIALFQYEQFTKFKANKIFQWS